MGKRDLWILTAAITVAAVVATLVFSQSAMETASWGLSFRQEGAPPIGTVENAQLGQYDAAYMGDIREKVIYLTFDAGYENGCTGKILDILAKHEVKAAFFLVGDYIQRNGDLTRRMVAEGHTVGNHTMHHPDMSKIGDTESFRKELTDLETLFSETTGTELPKFYRPPMGNYSEENLKAAQKLGYRTVFWSLAYVDWDQNNQPDPEKSLQKLLSRTHNGAVVLLHSTSATNAEILDRLLSQWKEQGYRFGTMEELFANSR